MLELRAPAPFTASYATLRFTRNQQGSSFTIHHPRGTTQRIAFGNNTNNPATGGDFLVTFNDGRVAPISSGCPLFNQNREVYSLLKRGPTACNEPCQPGALFCGNSEFVPVIDAWYGSALAGDPGAISSLGAWLNGSGGQGVPGLPPATYPGGIPSRLTGPDVVCGPSWYSLPEYPNGLPAGLPLTWELSGNLREVGRTANGILVEPNFNSSQAGGPGFVTAAVLNPAVSPLAFQTSRSRRDLQVGTPANTGITLTNQTNGTSFTVGQGGNLVLCANRQNILLASYNQPGGVTGGSWQFPADWQVSPVSGSNSASVWPLGGSTGNIVYFPGNVCGQATIPAVVPATVLFSGGPCGFGGWGVGRLSVWPNPATETVTVELPAAGRGPATATAGQGGPTGLQLYSAMGQLVRSQPWPAGLASTSVDLRGLLPGVYVLHVTFPDRVEVRRIVVDQPTNSLSN